MREGESEMEEKESEFDAKKRRERSSVGYKSLRGSRREARLNSDTSDSR